MFNEGNNEDYSPITLIGSFPIYLTELLVLIHTTCMVSFTIWAAATGEEPGKINLDGTLVSSLDAALSFDPSLILHQFQIWRLGSYALQNYPTFGFVIGMLMLWWFGRDIERFYGRRAFLGSYLSMVFVPALAALIPFLHSPLQGPQNVHFGLFLMFAATYPGAALLFNITAKLMAFVFLGISSMAALAGRDWTGFFHLWLIAALAYGLTRWLGRGEWLPAWLQDHLPSFHRKPAFSVVRDTPVARPEDDGPPADDPVSSIDPILEKISRRGMGSLTAQEREALRAASGELQRKDQGK